jgi:hypothetical protein
MSSANFPMWLNFTVNVTSGDDVDYFKLVIPRNASGFALFRWVESISPDGWSATPDEFDPVGWPTVIIFESNGTNVLTTTSGPLQYDLNMSISRVTVCEYTFIVYTTDVLDYTVTNEIMLILDPDAPEINMINPSANETVITATYSPYPTDWYFVMNLTVSDAEGTHDSGIASLAVYIDDVWVDADDVAYTGLWDPPTASYYYNTTVWNLPNGTHTLNVTVVDGAGNSANLVWVFDLIVPKKVSIDPTSGTVGPDTTFNPDTLVYTGSTYTYMEKTLGTWCTVTGVPGSMTANSTVNVTVYGLPYAPGGALVYANATTDSEGAWSASFYFPTAPHGTYTVYCEDNASIWDEVEFTVLPEIIYEPLIIVGPATVTVKATGLPAYLQVIKVDIDGTDALMGVNDHVAWNWWFGYGWATDENGTLKTCYELEYPGVLTNEPGLLIPILEPGTYEISLEFWPDEGEAHTYLIWNYLYVANDFDTISAILADLDMKLDDIMSTMEVWEPVILEINDNVASIQTDLGVISANIDDILVEVTATGDGVVAIETLVGTLEGKVDTIADNTATIKTDVGTIKLDVSTGFSGLSSAVSGVAADTAEISDAVVGLDEGLEAVPGAVNNITTTVWIAVILSLIAAVAAIAAVFMINRKIAS